ALDRAAEIDAYEPGHQKRLEMLKGKIDEGRYQVIASRFGTAAPVAPVRNEERTLGAGTLQDLMLQAEILVQYGMRNKALERLQRIQQLFPHEEDRNADLQQLYATAGMTPQYPNGPATPAPTPAATAASAPTAPVAVPAGSENLDMASFARVPDITRKLNRQSTADTVLNTAATEIGTQWKLSRCIVALRRPGLVTSTAKQFAASGLQPADPENVEQVVSALHELAINRGTLVYPDISTVTELQSLKQQLGLLGARSLLALPLMDGNDHLGLLLITEKNVRNWAQNDVLIFKMIADQVTIALNNAGLRRLVKNLSVTDENSGLLKRASYLDLLMGEVRRASQQASPVTVLIMRFGERATIAKGQGEAAADAMMQRLGQLVAANVRQNDLAFRYAANAIAIVLGET